jgi:membrane-bound lytic murein transglycosylase MltF
MFGTSERWPCGSCSWEAGVRIGVGSLLLVLILFFVVSGVAGAAVPERANQYRRLLVQSAHLQFGLNAPISLFAGQVHQESAWRPDARSKYAAGLTQFTPDTAKWIGQVYGRSLGPSDPLSPKWALAAMAKYNLHIHARMKWAATECDRWAFVLSGYNGGPGWVARDRQQARQQSADPDRWWGHVELHSRRAAWALKENRDYPRRIILRWQPSYLKAGWGGPIICEERL